MKYVPSATTVADLDITQAPYFGGEFAVYLTPVSAVRIGEIWLSAAGAGQYTANAGAAIKSAGADLQVVPITPLISAVEPIIKLAGLDDTATTPVAMDGTASFIAPARASNQSFSFSRGYATDLVGSAGKKFTSITGLASAAPITGGQANVKFAVYQLPEAADYALIGATTDIDFNMRGRQAKGIDDGMETDAWIKRGKTGAGELSIGSKLKSFAEGMTRFDGAKCTAMLVGIKDGQITGDRLVFTEFVANVKVKLPAEDGEVTCDAAGKYREALFFVAP